MYHKNKLSMTLYYHCIRVSFLMGKKEEEDKSDRNRMRKCTEEGRGMSGGQEYRR